MKVCSGAGTACSSPSRPASRISRARTIRSRIAARGLLQQALPVRQREQAVGGEQVGQVGGRGVVGGLATSRRSSTPWCSSAGGRRGPTLASRRGRPSAAGASGRYSTLHEVGRASVSMSSRRNRRQPRVTMSKRPSGSRRTSRISARAADAVQAASVVARAPVPRGRRPRRMSFRHRPGDEVDGQLAVAGFENVQRKRRSRQQHRAQGEQRKSLGHHSPHGKAARAARSRRPPGGRSTANGSVTRTPRSANRNSAGGPAARAARAARSAGRLEHAAAGQHPLQVGRRDRWPSAAE